MSGGMYGYMWEGGGGAVGKGKDFLNFYLRSSLCDPTPSWVAGI